MYPISFGNQPLSKQSITAKNASNTESPSVQKSLSELLATVEAGENARRALTELRNVVRDSRSNISPVSAKILEDAGLLKNGEVVPAARNAVRQLDQKVFTSF